MLREFVERKVRRQIVRQSLLISALAFAAILFLWNSEAMSSVMHPLRMFINNIHGGLSALAMQVTGGSVDSFTLSRVGSYEIRYQGGADALIMSAGYLGSALLGAVAFFLVNRAPHLIRLMSIVTGIFTVGFLALFIRPDGTGDAVSMLICMAFGLFLIVLGWKGKGDINQLRSRKTVARIVMTVVALMTGLHIILDLPYVLSTPIYGGFERITNPVAYFAENVLSGASLQLVAFSWAGIAVALMAAAFYLSVPRQLKKIPKNDDIV